MPEHKCKVSVTLQHAVDERRGVLRFRVFVIESQNLFVVFKHAVEDLEVLVRRLLAVCFFLGLFSLQDFKLVVVSLRNVLLLVYVVYKGLFALVGETIECKE